MTGPDHVILVAADDSSIGTAEKLEAHQRGLRHRALSVVIRNGRGEMLIQQRASGKYHSAGLWANTVCSHPRPHESVGTAVRRRLSEEMGLSCDLRPLLTTAYCAPVGDGLTENEVCHLWIGRHNGPVSPDPAEVADYRWMSRRRLLQAMAIAPQDFAPWFHLYIQRFADRLFAD